MKVLAAKECVSSPIFVYSLLGSNHFNHSPIRSNWLGAVRFATNREELEKVAVTRQEYLEHGSVRIAKKFTGAGIG